SQIANAATASNGALMNLIWSEIAISAPARTSTGQVAAGACLAHNNRQIAATAGASAGISTMQDELSSRNAGEAISNPAARPPAHTPPVRTPIMNRAEIKTNAAATVSNRGP